MRVLSGGCSGCRGEYGDELRERQPRLGVWIQHCLRWRRKKRGLCGLSQYEMWCVGTWLRRSNQNGPL